MTKIGILDFKGISGHKYTFNVYQLRKGLKEKEAVYVVTRRTIQADTTVKHTVIYVGEASNLKEIFDNHPKADCFEKEGANTVCVYWEDHAMTREKIKVDLKNLYHPPCNNC